jgi:hypothetical protein
LPLRYRSASTGWCDATTLNVSRSGILLRPAGALPAEGEVDVVLTLPPCDAFPRARVRCIAAVIRRADSDLAALAIRRYRFLKPGDTDEAAPGDMGDVE